MNLFVRGSIGAWPRYLTLYNKLMAQGFYKDVAVTGKGQLTLPPKIRKAMNLGAKGKIRISMTGTGVVTMQPLKDVMSLFGALGGPGAYDPDEKSRAQADGKARIGETIRWRGFPLIKSMRMF